MGDFLPRLFGVLLCKSEVTCNVNYYRPVSPGHVLICPNRIVERYVDLTEDEARQMWKVTRRVGKMLKSHYKPMAVLYGIQDGENAGQTVKHVHIHAIPRCQLLGKDKQIIDDELRKDRTKEERATEAYLYRKILSEEIS